MKKSIIKVFMFLGVFSLGVAGEMTYRNFTTVTPEKCAQIVVAEVNKSFEKPNSSLALSVLYSFATLHCYANSNNPQAASKALLSELSQ